MNYPVFTLAGEKKGTRDIPATLLADHLNKGLMHQAVVMQQSNRRQSAAHVKTRGEVAGSTKKPYPQKHTGNARRGPMRSPLMRGGGKAFGPRNDRNFTKRMPQAMRHAALRACLTLQAKEGIFVGLESFPETIKTKQVHDFLKKVAEKLLGRRILIVLPSVHNALHLSARNIPGVKSVDAAYLNPEDILVSRQIIVVGDALEKAAEIFGTKSQTTATKGSKATKATKKKASNSLDSSDSSDSSVSS